VADALGLALSQKERIRRIHEEMRRTARDMFQRRADSGGAPLDFHAVCRQGNSELLAVLTDEQRVKWKDLQGEHFAGQIPLGFPCKWQPNMRAAKSFPESEETPGSSAGQ